MGTAYLAGVTFRDRSWRKQVGRRTVTAFALACVGLSGTGAALMAATAAGATTVTSYTWTGASASATLGDWSLPSNWSGGAAPSGSVGTLTFPDLSANSACTTTPQTEACYVSTDNVPGIGASGLDFTQSTGAYFIGSAGGASLGIGSGGISATGATSRDSLNVPLQLTANQVWTVSKSTELTIAGGISAAPGQTPAPTLGVTLSGQSVLGLGGPVETGGFTATGATASDTGNQAYRNGLVAIGNPSVVGDLNGSGSGASVAVTDVAFLGAGTTGPLTATGGAVMAGYGSKAPGTLAIAGRAAFDSHSVLDLTITQSGTAPGTDYSQLDASGTVNLGGVGLQVASGYDAPPTPPATSPTPVCTTPAMGTTYTLVSAGTLVGEVAGPTGPVASGGIVPLAFPQGCTNPNEALQLHYNTSSTPSTLTGTVVSASTGLPSPDHTLFVNAATGSDGSNDCQATPCATIQHAVLQAETLPGSVQVEIASGTYREQVTIAPGGSSPMTSLTLQGPVLGSPPAVVEPASLVQNVTEGSTGNFFDDNTGDTAAIIGVQTGSPDTAAGVDTATSQPVPVTVANLTVSGVNLGGLPPGGELEGIAFVDTSGGIIGNTVEHIEQASAMGQAAVHGIEVKATAGPAAVTVSGNTAKNDAGHVAVDLMSAPGDLTATVTGNTLTGDPVATTTPVAQFGVAAGGLAGLTVAGNTIADFQSPWSVGAVWLDAQSAGAACSVTGNTLVANDNGVDLHGASGCTISGNDISAGSAGVEIGPSYTGSPAVPSSGNSVTNNAITGTTTEASTLSYDGTSTPASAVAGVPVDGVLVWDGSQNTVAGNAVSGFVHDVYAGEDPVYLNNTASWGAGMPASYSGNTVGVSVSDNSLTVPAAAVAGSDVTSVGAAELNAPTGTLPMVATDNWWGCAGGPNEAGCATTAGSVTTTTWLAALAIAPASQTVASGATATLTATLQDNTGAAVLAPLGVRYTTTPGVGSGVVALATAGAGAGSAVFDVSSAGAGTVDVSAALTFGTDPTAAGAEAAGPSGSATVTFSSPPTASPVSGPPTPPPAPPGSTSSDSGSSDSPTGTATASVGGTTASGIGEGSLTVSQYGSDPAGAPTFASAGAYFDVEVATGSRFSSLTITDCNLNGGTSLQYWTGSSWVAVSPASYSAGPPACVTASLSSSSTPTIAQLTGTVFAVVAPKTAPASSPPSTKAASGAQGYRLVASDGGVFSFGAAAFYGSLGATHLNEPVVATAATPDGKGYWLVASDGGVFAFGDAAYHGSLPADGVHVADVVGMAAAPGGTGYWLVGADGGVFAFGGAGYFGSAPGAGAHVADVRAIVAASSGDGYWLAGADGGIFAFGAAGYEGSLPGIGVHVSDVVGLAGMP